MNDEQKAIDQLSIVMNRPKEEIARIIKRIQLAYRDEQEKQYREMKQEIGYRCPYFASSSFAPGSLVPVSLRR